MTTLDGPTPMTDKLISRRNLDFDGEYIWMDFARNLERLLAEAVGALELIMHARRNPKVTLTDMSRAGMRELAGEALARIKAAKEQI